MLRNSGAAMPYQQARCHVEGSNPFCRRKNVWLRHGITVKPEYNYYIMYYIYIVLQYIILHTKLFIYIGIYTNEIAEINHRSKYINTHQQISHAEIAAKSGNASNFYLW